MKIALVVTLALLFTTQPIFSAEKIVVYPERSPWLAVALPTNWQLIPAQGTLLASPSEDDESVTVEIVELAAAVGELDAALKETEGTLSDYRNMKFAKPQKVQQGGLDAIVVNAEGEDEDGKAFLRLVLLSKPEARSYVLLTVAAQQAGVDKHGRAISAMLQSIKAQPGTRPVAAVDETPPPTMEVSTAAPGPISPAPAPQLLLASEATQATSPRGYLAPRLEILEVGTGPLLTRYHHITLRRTRVVRNRASREAVELKPIHIWEHDFRFRDALARVGVGGKFAWHVPLYVYGVRRGPDVRLTDTFQEIFEVVSATPMTEIEVTAYDLLETVSPINFDELKGYYNRTNPEPVHRMLANYYGAPNPAVPHWARNQAIAAKEIADSRTEVNWAVWDLIEQFETTALVRTELRQRPASKLAAANHLLKLVSTGKAEALRDFLRLSLAEMNQALAAPDGQAIPSIVLNVIAEFGLVGTRAIEPNFALLKECDTSYPEDAAVQILQLAWQLEKAKGTSADLNTPKSETVAAFGRMMEKADLKLTAGIQIGGGVPDRRILIFYARNDPESRAALKRLAQMQKELQIPRAEVWAVEVIPDVNPPQLSRQFHADFLTSFATNSMAAQQMRFYLQTSTAPRIYVLKRYDLVFEAQGAAGIEQLRAYLTQR